MDYTDKAGDYKGPSGWWDCPGLESPCVVGYITVLQLCPGRFRLSVGVPPGLGSQIDAGLTDYEKLDLRTGTRCLEELFVNCCLQ